MGQPVPYPAVRPAIRLAVRAIVKDCAGDEDSAAVRIAEWMRKQLRTDAMAFVWALTLECGMRPSDRTRAATQEAFALAGDDYERAMAILAEQADQRENPEFHAQRYSELHQAIVSTVGAVAEEEFILYRAQAHHEGD
jgi:hypothetical protein